MLDQPSLHFGDELNPEAGIVYALLCLRDYKFCHSLTLTFNLSMGV